jgi:hypothetical protein
LGQPLRNKEVANAVTGRRLRPVTGVWRTP